MRFTRLLFFALFCCASFASLYAQSTTTATVLRPYITSISPESLLTGVDSTVLTIKGRRFQRGAEVFFSARKLTKTRLEGDSVLVVIIPGELTTNPDVAVLIIENPDETKVGLRVRVRDICDIGPAGHLIRPSVVPSSTAATMQAFRLTITNSATQDFKLNARLFLNASPLSIIYNDGRTLIANVPAILNTTGTYALQLVPENVCFNQIYTIRPSLAPAPMITKIFPGYFTPGGGILTITGLNFSTQATVQIGSRIGSTMLSIVSSTSNRIVAIIPPNLPLTFYILSVVNSDGQSDFTTIVNPLSVNANISSFTTLSPNPATTALTLETTLDRSATLTLTLRNVMGAAVLEERHTAASGRFSTTLDVSALANGVYMLEVSDGTGGRWVQKVVKY